MRKGLMAETRKEKELEEIELPQKIHIPRSNVDGVGMRGIEPVVLGFIVGGQHHEA
jgi:hypothetical protein